MDETGMTHPHGLRIRHTMLRVADLERSIDFYTGRLGMRVMRRRENPAERVAYVGYGEEESAHALELTQELNGGRTAVMGNCYGHVALAVPDLDAFHDALKAAGVRFTMEPGPIRPGSSVRVAFVADPDGYEIELTGRQ